MLKIVLLTSSVPSYRIDFLQRVAEQSDIDFTVICSQTPSDSGMADASDEFTYIKVVKAYSIKPLRLFWQSLPWKSIVCGDSVIVVMGNPRYLSNVILSVLLFYKRKPQVVFGHGFPSSSIGFSMVIRQFWWERVFNFCLVYTDEEAERLKVNEGAFEKVVGLQNGLNQDEIERQLINWNERSLVKWREEKHIGEGPILLSCARLVPKNKFDEFLPIFSQLKKRIYDLKWMIIGDGPQFAEFERMIKEHHLEDSVTLVGKVYDQAALAPYFMAASLFIHPGSIGLSLLHAFGYGLPVITHNAVELHRPEIAALKDEYNGLLFQYNDAKSFQKKVYGALNDPIQLHELSKNAINTARNEFNTRVMTNRFIDICRSALAYSGRA